MTIQSDMPTIASVAYATAAGTNMFDLTSTGNPQPHWSANALRRFQNARTTTTTITQPNTKETEMAATKRRIVKVYIVDPDESVPLAQSLLYEGDQKLTDLTDQELYFEIDMKSILDKHNAVRTTTRNKKVKEREEMLEPARIRDLKMVVVTLAEF